MKTVFAVVVVLAGILFVGYKATNQSTDQKLYQEQVASRKSQFEAQAKELELRIHLLEVQAKQKRTDLEQNYNTAANAVTGGIEVTQDEINSAKERVEAVYHAAVDPR